MHLLKLSDFSLVDVTWACHLEAPFTWRSSLYHHSINSKLLCLLLQDPSWWIKDSHSHCIAISTWRHSELRDHFPGPENIRTAQICLHGSVFRAKDIKRVCGIPL